MQEITRNIANVFSFLCNNSDRTWFFNALTFARTLGRCWKPRPPTSVFNSSLGTWRMLMHEKTCLIPILYLVLLTFGVSFHESYELTVQFLKEKSWSWLSCSYTPNIPYRLVFIFGSAQLIKQMLYSGFRSPLRLFLCFTTVLLVICVSLWCFTDEAEYRYADRTYICNFELHQN